MEKRIKSNTIVIDIDDTLSWTAEYWVNLFFREIGNPEKLSPKEIVAKYQFVQNVPYWKGEKLNQLTHSLIHDDLLQAELPVIQGAKKYLKLLSKSFADIVYLSKRPEVVRTGTIIWLQSHDFPKGDLVLKPTNIPFELGNAWKSQTILQTFSHVTAIIDDDQNILEHLYPQYKGYFLLFGHKSQANDYKVVSCADWKETYWKLKQILTIKL